jgi:hypothetical protein
MGLLWRRYLRHRVLVLGAGIHCWDDIDFVPILLLSYKVIYRDERAKSVEGVTSHLESLRARVCKGVSAVGRVPSPIEVEYSSLLLDVL